jgi:hypothetical protein
MFDDIEDTLYDNDVCSQCGNYGIMEDNLCELCYADVNDPEDPESEDNQCH